MTKSKATESVSSIEEFDKLMLPNHAAQAELTKERSLRARTVGSGLARRVVERMGRQFGEDLADG